MSRLENWYEFKVGSSSVLIGEVHEDDRFEDGEVVTTSVVTSMSIESDVAITKSGTIYFLGEHA